jgi:hypothetical protein
MTTMRRPHNSPARAEPAAAPPWLSAPAALILLGGLCGLAWAAGLRGMMAQVAGDDSTVHWELTFGWLLLPSVLLGGLFAWADLRRRAGNGRGRRWFVAAPLLFAGVLFSDPAHPTGIFDNGVGGGAIAVPVIGMAGGYVLAAQGRLWARLACGLVALVPYPVWAVSATAVGGSELALSTPRGAWVAVYLYSFVLLLQAACAIPHLPAHVTPHNDAR